MDFDLSDEQRLLKDSVERLVADRYGDSSSARPTQQGAGRAGARRSGATSPSWACWPAVRREPIGGFGGGPVETMIVMEAIGRGLCAGALPRHGRARRGGAAARRQRGAAADRSSPQIVRRRAHALRFAYARAAVALRSRSTWRRPRRRDGDGLRARRRRRASCCTATARDQLDRQRPHRRAAGATASGISLFLVDAKAPGVARRGYPTQDGLRAAESALDRRAGSGRRRARRAGAALAVLERVVDDAIAALCAEAVGAMEAPHAAHRRLSEDAQAVRRADRHLPGAAAPRRRHAGGAGAGALAWRCSPP